MKTYVVSTKDGIEKSVMTSIARGRDFNSEVLKRGHRSWRRIDYSHLAVGFVAGRRLEKRGFVWVEV